MKQPTDTGMNKTGIDIAPAESKLTIEEAQQTPPSFPGDVSNLLAERARYHQEMMANPIGSVPPPGTLRGMASVGLQKLAIRKPEVFIDKLAERLAFERTGTRLYDALINKCEARAGEGLGIPIATLIDFRESEYRHFQLVRDSMRTLGADPTALTPSADTVAVESLGLVQVLTDARTDIMKCVHAILVAELTDNDGWQNLIALAESMNHSSMAESFRAALAEEDRHLVTIRELYNQLVLQDAKVA